MEVEQIVEKNGFKFILNQHKRLPDTKGGLCQYKAIYIAEDEDLKNIEVVILRESKPHYLSGKTENVLRYPSSEEWGVYGFTYRSMELAEKKYENISVD